MRFWFDTEFHERGAEVPIDFISIGIVSEDGQEYYAVSSEFDLAAVQENDWLVANVLPHLGDQSTWKPRAQIAREILAFVETGDEPEWWSYYADYDWVVLCQLYGSMIQLPEGWPMFALDIKQWAVQLGNPPLPPMQQGQEHNALADAHHHRAMWRFLNQHDDVHRCPVHPRQITEYAPCQLCELDARAPGAGA